jgi:hypothetical protein
MYVQSFKINIKRILPNLTVMSCNASAVKIHNAMSSLVHFESKSSFFNFEKNYLASYNAGVEVVNFQVVGLTPEVVGLAPGKPLGLCEE